MLDLNQISQLASSSKADIYATIAVNQLKFNSPMPDKALTNRLKSSRFKLIFSSALLLFVSACSDGQIQAEDKPQPAAYQYKIPQYQDDGWQVGHLADHDFDESLISDLVDNIQNETFPGIDSISIVRNNTLLLHEDFRQEYSEYDHWMGNDQLNKHIMHSTSKSFVSALMGIAIQQGFISDVNTPFYPMFNYLQVDNWDARKETITLKDALTMQLGLEWDEWTLPYSDPNNSLTKMAHNNTDYIKALLELPLAATPGTTYSYNTAASIALGRAIEIATNMPLQEFANLYLFEPMQFSEPEWLTIPTGTPDTGSGLFLKTRDMAKFGQLYLDQGKWNNYPILSSDWVNQSLQQHVELNWDYTDGYGFQWWLGNFNLNQQSIPFYSTRGYGGQLIIIVPNYDLVIAFTGHNYDDGLYDSTFSIVENRILTAIINPQWSR